MNVVITSTGTLEATNGRSRDSGIGKIEKLYVDFNSEVKKGQLLAIIDTVNLVSQLRDARANLSKAKAVHNEKVLIHEKNKKLYEKNYISELSFIQSQTDVESSLAELKSAESAVERAKTNLDYAYIFSPISGKIIYRNVEQGQTVAASLSAPTIYTIAEDLSSMKILASVDESNIGQIKEGQKVKFTVQAYPNKTFDGIVTQIRLEPSTSSNIVNYTVVILADNTDKLLLPGMTATIDFYIDHRENVLLTPNAALRVEATDDMMKAINKNIDEKRTNLPSNISAQKNNIPPPPEGGMPGNNNNDLTTKKNMMRVFYIDKEGKLKMCPVLIGLTDGKNTEIIIGRELKEGTQVITGILESGTTTKTNTSNNPTPPPPSDGGPSSTNDVIIK